MRDPQDASRTSRLPRSERVPGLAYFILPGKRRMPPSRPARIVARSRDARGPASSVDSTQPSVDIDKLRELCLVLLADVPTFQRSRMLKRLRQMRRADDLWQLRAALFDTISHCHGEATARERIAMLDEQLASPG